MRKAKVAAIIFGGVSSCLFGGLFGVYATAPVVSSVAPENNVESVYEVESDDLANVAAVTPIRTTTVTTKGKTTTTTKTAAFSNAESAVKTFSDKATAAAAVSNSIVEAATEAASEAITEAASEAITEDVTEEQFTAPALQAAPARIEAPAEPVTEAETEAYTEAETETATEAPEETYEEVYYEETAPEEEESYTETYEEPCTEPETVDVAAPAESTLPISESDYIILCNAVAHEAGCYWIDEYDKAKVVEVIMNRVNSPLYPNTITGVLTQPYQFSGSSSYVYLGTYSGYVTDSVKNAVNLYFNEPGSFAHGYFSFYGDGYRNYFS